MAGLASLSRTIDAVSTAIGRWVAWLIVAAAVISAGNAIVRKAFDVSSNAWLEIQWWLFAAVFLLAAPWTLARDEHIRVDVVNARLSRRTRDLIELAGITLFLIPMAAVLLYTSANYFATSLAQNEQSPNAGGLALWPIKALMPAAFALLLVQGVSELIKRVLIMRGEMAEPGPHAASFHEAVTEAGAALHVDRDDAPGRAPPRAGDEPRR